MKTTDRVAVGQCVPAETGVRRTFASPMPVNTWASTEYFDYAPSSPMTSLL